MSIPHSSSASLENPHSLSHVVNKSYIFNSTMCSDIGQASHCCVFYSAVGALFTLWVGVMLHTQPFYIAGIEDVDVAKSSAFGAFFAFVAVFLLSIVGIFYDNNYKKEPIADDEAAEGYQLSRGDVPTYGTSN